MNDDVRRLIDRENARMQRAIEEGDKVAEKGARENVEFLWQQFGRDARQDAGLPAVR